MYDHCTVHVFKTNNAVATNTILLCSFSLPLFIFTNVISCDLYPCVLELDQLKILLLVSLQTLPDPYTSHVLPTHPNSNKIDSRTKTITKYTCSRGEFEQSTIALLHSYSLNVFVIELVYIHSHA